MDGVKVRVPATSANLGPGFDCLGLALNLYNKLEAREDDRLTIVSEGEGARYIPADSSNLTYQAMKGAYEAAGRKCPGLFIRQINAIPLSRGLGSSAAAIVGGLVAANALMGNPLDRQELLQIATKLEGHPDNVAPCLYGGLTAAVQDGGQVHLARVLPDPRFAFAAMVPEFDLSTKKARQALPESYSKADAVHNVGHAVLMYAALHLGLGHQLKAACQDRLHQPYRKGLIPGWDDVNSAAIDAGALAVYLSGAGPTVMAVYDRQDGDFIHRLEQGLCSLVYRWDVLRLECCQEGATVKRRG